MQAGKAPAACRCAAVLFTCLHAARMSQALNSPQGLFSAWLIPGAFSVQHPAAQPALLQDQLLDQPLA